MEKERGGCGQRPMNKVRGKRSSMSKNKRNTFLFKLEKNNREEGSFNGGQ